MYSFFKDRYDSVTRAIASNQLGSVFPQALRLARCEDAGLNKRAPGDFLREQDLYVQKITLRHVKALVRNAKIVQGLENYYSFRWGTSYLAPESMMLICQMC